MNNDETKKKIIEILRLFEGRADRLREEIADALIVVGIGDVIDEFVERLKQDEESVKIGNEWKAVVRDVDVERIAAEMRQEVEK